MKDKEIMILVNSTEKKQNEEIALKNQMKHS
jgi:hypothetical protein